MCALQEIEVRIIGFLYFEQYFELGSGSDSFSSEFDNVVFTPSLWLKSNTVRGEMV